MAKRNSNATYRMVRVYSRTVDVASSKSRYGRIRMDAAERMVDDGAARWVAADAIQLTGLTSEAIAYQPTISDADCEINAGAYAGIGPGAAETLSAQRVEAVRNKVAVWPEIFDERAPLPGYYRDSHRSRVPGVTLMSPDELQQLSDAQIVFTGSEARELSHDLRGDSVRCTGNDYVMQHSMDDEPEPEPEMPVEYHEVCDSELVA